MITYGISANEHDAALAVAHEDKIVFASHAERYSRRKNDPHLSAALLEEAREFGTADQIVWYEKPFRKRLRKAWSGQWSHAFRRDGRAYLRSFGLDAPVRYVRHHEAHAAWFYASPFDEAAVLVVDAIGEWTTISIWHGRDGALRQMYSQAYPHSLGLLYSAFTDRVGLKPNEEEYIMMGMAALGKPIHVDAIDQDFVEPFSAPALWLKHNVHRGVRWWRPDITNRVDIAASIQQVTEHILLGLARWAAQQTGSRNLVFAGGVALNCVANSAMARAGDFREIWIPPDPGDAGSSISAIAAYRRARLQLPGPYLGHAINRPFRLRGGCRGAAGGRGDRVRPWSRRVRTESVGQSLAVG